MEFYDEEEFADTVCDVFRANLRRLRREQKLTQLTLSYQASISSGLIGDIESGRRNPTLTTIAKIAYALKVPTHMLLLTREDLAEIKRNSLNNNPQ